MNNRIRSLLDNVQAYYSQKIETYGAVPSGVDWNSKESQELRFAQLLKVCNAVDHFSINDYGCGYGSLYAYLKEKRASFTYYGFDVSESMIQTAEKFLNHPPNAHFQVADRPDNIADFTVASGLFNVKLDVRELTPPYPTRLSRFS